MDCYSIVHTRNIMAVKFLGVTGDMIGTAWPVVEPMIQKPLTKTGADKYFSTRDIKKLIKSHNMQLWVAVVDDKPVAAFVTQIIEYPKCKVFDVFLVGGEKMRDWINEAWETLKQYGKECHCKGIRGFGREGWVRALPEDISYSVMWDLEL